MTKNIVFTDAATTKFNEVQDEFRKRFKAELKNRKQVPGDETVEVTASDINDLDRSTRIRFIGADTYRAFTRDTLIKSYLAIGILTFVAGLFYPYLRSLADNPVQLMLMAMGATMAFASYFLTRILDRRRAELEDRFEAHSKWHELVDRHRRIMELEVEAQRKEIQIQLETKHQSTSGT